MPKFKVGIHVDCVGVVEVEAETEAQAEAIAEKIWENEDVEIKYIHDVNAICIEREDEK